MGLSEVMTNRVTAGTVNRRRSVRREDLAGAVADRHDDTYENWLRGHHAQFGTPFEVIDDLVRRATGSGVARIERIGRGESNEVHAVTSCNGDEVIVRLNHSDGAAGFRRAEAVIGRARAIGIPVPDSLLIEEIEVDGDERGVCVQRRLKGTPLADSVKGITSDDVKALVADAGELLARLHSLPAEHEPRSAWWQQVPDFAIERARAALGAGASLVDDALEALAAIVASHAPDEPTTVHSDFGTEHLLVDGGRITGIIDWDEATVSSPMADLANWDSYYDWEPHPTSTLIAGYERVRSLPDDHLAMRTANSLTITIWGLEYYYRVNNLGAVCWTGERLAHFIARAAAL